MTDARLRELERGWRRTGSAYDEARYLGERLRTGQLDERALRLAAHLGHVAASRLLGLPPARRGWAALLPWRREARAREAAEPWVMTLRPFGQEALLRAATGPAVDLLPVLTRWAAGETGVPGFLEAMQRWVLGPGPETFDALSAARARLEEAAAGRWAWREGVGSDAGAAYRATLALWPANQRSDEEQAVWCARHAARNWGICHWEAPLSAFQAVVRAELLPWALGYSDPVALRVNQVPDAGPLP